MRDVILTTPYKRDLKKIKHSGKCFIEDIESVINTLRNDTPLPGNMRDHALTGAWQQLSAKECHIKPNILLVYRKPENELHLLRITNHSELFG